MGTLKNYYDILMQVENLQQEVMALIRAQSGGNSEALQQGADSIDRVRSALISGIDQEGSRPADGGDAARLGLGPEARGDIGDVFTPTGVAPYDEQVVSGRLFAVADLYYCYQHERLGLFRAVHKLQELFRAGALRLTDGPGALGLYRFDIKSVLRYTYQQRLQAYRRVFGYTNVTPPAGSRPNIAFHGLLQGFTSQIAQLFRDRRIAEIVRGPASTTDATFGSVAAARRAGLDFRSNLKHAAYGDVNVLTVELLQLLRQGFDILGAEDVRSQFGTDNAWDTLEEVLKRHLNEESVASQRSRMGVAGRDVIRWLAAPFVLVSSRNEFESLAMEISEPAEEWLTSAQSVGLAVPARSGDPANVVPFRRMANQ